MGEEGGGKGTVIHLVRGAACISLGDSAQVVGKREGRRRKKRKEEAKDVGGGVGWRRKGTFLIALF